MTVNGEVYIAMLKTMQIMPIMLDLAVVVWKPKSVMRRTTTKKIASTRRTINIFF